MEDILKNIQLSHRCTIYLESTVTWYDLKTKTEVVNTKSFSKITKSVGTQGVTGLDCLLSFMISSELQNFLGQLEKVVVKDKSVLQILEDASKNFKNKLTGRSLNWNAQ